MLNAGILASSSSLVVVPDLSGLNSAQVLSALSALDLSVGTTSTTSSGADSSNNGKVSSQSPAAGSFVERYSQVGYVTYSYTAPSPTPSPVTYNFYASGCCNGSPIYDAGNDYSALQARFLASCSGGTLTNVTYGNINTGYIDPGCSTTPVPVPTPSYNIPVWYSTGCCNGTILQSSSSASSSGAYDNLDSQCTNYVISNVQIQEGIFGEPSWPSITCTTTPTPTPLNDIVVWYSAGCCNGSVIQSSSSASSSGAYDNLDSLCPNYVLSNVEIVQGTYGYQNWPSVSCSTPTPAPSPTPAPAPAPSPAPVTWYCSYSGSDGSARSSWPYDLSSYYCDGVTVCSTSGYPPYPGYPGC